MLRAFPPDEKVKVAYIVHHEGPKGGLMYLKGILQEVEDSRGGTVGLLLAKQFKDKKNDGTAKAKALADRFGGDYVKAYYYFLACHTDTAVRATSFMINQHGFKERSSYEVIKAVSNLTIEMPASQKVNRSTVSSEPSTDVVPRTSTANGVGGVEAWSDPLDLCRIRTGGYADSATNPKMARAKSLFGGRDGKHTGIDLCAVRGTPVKAVANGVIHYASDAGTYGKVIVLMVDVNDLPPKQKMYARSKLPEACSVIYFMYAHLSELGVKKTGSVPVIIKAGQVIGKTGDTGNAKGMVEIGDGPQNKCGGHLHFEVRRSDSLKKGQGQWFDPKPFLNQCD